MALDKSTATESQVWEGVKDLLGRERITLGHHWSFNLRQDPKRFPFVLSRYKFAARMVAPALGPARSVLELGCSEGIGTPILAEFASRYHGVDLDTSAVETAQANWASPSRTFEADDFLGKSYGRFEGVVSLDVVEHIMPEVEPRYWQSIVDHLTDDGVAVVGTPNQTSEAYASPMSKAGHVNLFTGERMVETMRQWFHTVLLFGLNDEVVHTGFAPMCHYVMGVGIGPRAACRSR